MASILTAPKHWIERFKLHQKAAARRATENGCWLWIEKTNAQGYGVYRWFDPLTRKQYSCAVHRASLELKLSRTLLPGEQGRHVCPGVEIPNRCCFNPDHLVPGTQSENEKDKALAKLRAERY